MKFSIVIAVAPERNVEIIDSLKSQNYPISQFHVIVIKGKNPSENRNRGAEKARGEIIGFLDDDAMIDEDFLKNVEGFFEKYPQIDIVGGPQLTPYDDTGFAKISGYALSSKFGAAGSAKRYQKGKLDLNADEKSITSANMFVRKEVMDRIKFEPKLWPGEDPKFIGDAKKLGFRVAYSPDFFIYHRRRPTIRSFIKQIFNYGKVRPQKESFTDTIRMPQFLVPSLFIMYLLVLLGIIIVNPAITGNVININPHIQLKIFTLLLVPLFLYIILTFLFSIYESAKNKDYKAVLFLPFIYFLIHISYGTGMIWSYIRKLK